MIKGQCVALCKAHTPIERVKLLTSKKIVQSLLDVEDDPEVLREARLIADKLSDDSADDEDEEYTEVVGSAQPCEGTDSEDEEASKIPHLSYIKVKCADCGYPYNPTDKLQRHRHRVYVKKQQKKCERSKRWLRTGRPRLAGSDGMELTEQERKDRRQE